MMNGADKKTKKKIRISIIDVLIVVAFIACVGGIFVHYQIYEKNNAVVTDDSCYLSLLFSGVSNEYSDSASVGDKVYRDGVLLGTVATVSVADAEVYYRNAKDEIVQTVDTGKKDVTVVVDVKGDVTDMGFLANGVEYMAAGMKIDVNMSKFSGNGLIFDVKKQSE